MSLLIDCTNKDLSLTDIYRLVTGVSDDGNFYIRTYNDGTSPNDLVSLADCESGDITVLDILRGLLVVNDAGDYALNISILT